MVNIEYSLWKWWSVLKSSNIGYRNENDKYRNIGKLLHPTLCHFNPFLYGIFSPRFCIGGGALCRGWRYWDGNLGKMKNYCLFPGISELRNFIGWILQRKTFFVYHPNCKYTKPDFFQWAWTFFQIRRIVS